MNENREFIKKLEKEYDTLITENEERHRRKVIEDTITMVVMIMVALAIVLWAATGFPDLFS